MRKYKRIKADRIERFGPIIMAQYGKTTFMKNVANQEEHEKTITLLADNYESSKAEIDKLIIGIRERISKVNPLKLLHFLRDMGHMVNFGKLAEIDYDSDDCFTMRAIEYTLSVLMSMSNSISADDDKDYSLDFNEILSCIIDLYYKVQQFILPFSAKMKIEGKYNDEEIGYIIEELIHSLIRGERFQIYQQEHLNSLLKEYDNIFNDVYNMSAADLMEGLSRLEYSLAKGQADAINDSMAQFDEFSKVNNGSFLSEEWHNKASSTLESIFTCKLNDVINVTGWKEAFVNDLSYEIGEYKNFYDGEFGGWPIIDLPIQKKPFIKIADKYYCFDYYSLFDNIYRVIQKTFRQKSPKYVPIIADIQKNTSESMVANIFRKLLPDAQIYCNNYYPKETLKKEFDENDILIKYKDILIIVEVKAGAFTYTSSFLDYDAHKKSIDNLINKSSTQCSRMLTYIQKCKEKLILFNEERMEKTSLDIENNIVYSFCVTLDNFNEITAKAEKVNHVNIDSGTIIISIDDLRVYRDYFDNPLVFLHYLEQRKIACNIKNLYLSDELDHLALYINHNVYSLFIKDYEENTRFEILGYRKELEDYFMSLYDQNIQKEKPLIKLPPFLGKTIDFLTQKREQEARSASSGILSYSNEAKNQLEKLIEHSLSRAIDNRNAPILFAGPISYCVFVSISGKLDISEDLKYRYTCANMINSNKDGYYSLELIFNVGKELTDVIVKRYWLAKIKPEDFNSITKYGTELVSQRINTMQINRKTKIGRNEKCPCGSGKKFKNCCLQ